MRRERRKTLRRLSCFSILILGGFLASPRLGEAASFPAKPIEMTVLFGAGSGADLLARKLADAAGKDLGQSILVVNRTGAGGAIGYNYLRGQAPDGYAIVWNSNSISTAYHAGNMTFDYTAFSGVAELTTEPVSLAVKADAPWKDIGEFVAYAKQNPGKVRIGNSGRGSFTHLTGVALENVTGAKVIHVPFGQALAVATLLGEKIEGSIQLPAEIVAQVRGKQVRVLAVTGDKRLPSLPEVPTFKEMGIDLTLSLWRGIAVPKGTPEPVIARLEAAFRAAAESQAFRDFATEMGATIEFRGAKAFDQFIAVQDKELAGLMDQIGMKKQ
ncbi:MAG TPA: tripartite tricarboxylate transporter substrate binding protein [Candidatus Methylomirabilis sp.]|nr:tripartite tricarboxylate transporter substrate binding protein [Candidatus Methylomirabilis sp.]